MLQMQEEHVTSNSDYKVALRMLVSPLANTAGALVQLTGSFPLPRQDCKPLLSIARSRSNLPNAWYTVTDPIVRREIVRR